MRLEESIKNLTDIYDEINKSWVCAGNRCPIVRAARSKEEF